MRSVTRAVALSALLLRFLPALSAEDASDNSSTFAASFRAYPAVDLLVSFNSSTGLPTLPQMRAEAGFPLMFGVAEWFSVGVVPELLISGPSFPSPVGISYRGFWGAAALLSLDFALQLDEGLSLGLDLRGGIVYGNYLLTNQEILYLRAEARPTLKFPLAEGLKLSIALPFVVEPRPDVLVLSTGLSASIIFSQGGK